MNIVLLFGLPGTGKKTVGQLLEKRMGYLLFDNHIILDIVRRYIPRESPESAALARSIRLNIIERAAAVNAHPGMILTMAGGTSGATEAVTQWFDAVRRHGGKTFLVELTCPIETLRERIKHESRKGTTKLTTDKELDAFMQKDYFKGIPDHPILRIDNSGTPEECVEMIIKEIGV